MSDPHLWLEDVTDEAALDWAREHNERTIDELASSERFRTLSEQILEILDTDARIPYPGRRGDYWYNFWRDADHPRGLWRRTTLDEYRTDRPEWDVLLDLDELARVEGENWVWGGAEVLRPSQSRALISLSRGGADAGVEREFDLATRTFVNDGFQVPEAKTSIGWIDIDTVYVGTDFGDGSLTESGYPRVAKRWRRGTEIESAETVFEGEPSDISVGAGYDRSPGFERHYVRRGIGFFDSELSLLEDDGTLTRIDAPTDASVGWHHNWLMIRLNSPWAVGATEYPAGALLASDFTKFLAGARHFDVLFEPDAHTSLHQYRWTENHLLLVTLSDVRTKLYSLTPTDDGWTRQPLPDLPPLATTEVFSTDPIDNGDEFLLTTSGFTTPASLLYGKVGGGVEELKQAPAFFDADDILTEQFFATSLDGTQVPYFVVRRRGTSGPTILSGYGGFENSLTPAYAGVSGRAWVSTGGISVTANVRGGGEYGPEWHTQAQKAGRHRVHEDFAAVAQDLVSRGITTPAQLGAIGGSNGGLLMGIMLTKYPKLFGALVCRVPLLDMKRYHLLLAGASWVAEYGDPDDPDEWAFIREYSPYQNTSAEATYPPILFTTSTRDDRVHPGHARKMVAQLEAEGHEQVWYYENIEGGHGGAADNQQAAFQTALAYEFFTEHLR